MPATAPSPSAQARSLGWTRVIPASGVATDPRDVPGNVFLGIGFGLGVTLCLCCIMRLLVARQRRRHAERQPLLNSVAEPVREASQWSGEGIAAIGTPARDFVRLSSLPASIFRPEEADRRCMACGETGKCVALRPCGHIVLCRSCSDFVYTCPQCGQYISGVSGVPSISSGNEHRAIAGGGTLEPTAAYRQR